MTRPNNFYYAILTVHLYQPTPLFTVLFVLLTLNRILSTTMVNERLLVLALVLTIYHD